MSQEVINPIFCNCLESTIKVTPTVFERLYPQFVFDIPHPHHHIVDHLDHLQLISLGGTVSAHQSHYIDQILKFPDWIHLCHDLICRSLEFPLKTLCTWAVQDGSENRFGLFLSADELQSPSRKRPGESLSMWEYRLSNFHIECVQEQGWRSSPLTSLSSWLRTC